MDDSFEESFFVVKPYQFEPEATSSDESDCECGSLSGSESEVDISECVDDLLPVSEWCRCDCCVGMPTVIENRCCQTMNVVDLKLDGLKCITSHEGFQVNCLNVHVLETSYYEHVLLKGPMEEDQQIHELYRYLAYRRFTRWIYGLLSKRCRKVIPSCVVNAIRDRFPSEEYCGFKYPQ